MDDRDERTDRGHAAKSGRHVGAGGRSHADPHGLRAAESVGVPNGALSLSRKIGLIAIELYQGQQYFHHFAVFLLDETGVSGIQHWGAVQAYDGVYIVRPDCSEWRITRRVWQDVRHAGRYRFYWCPGVGLEQKEPIENNELLILKRARKAKSALCVGRHVIHRKQSSWGPLLCLRMERSRSPPKRSPSLGEIHEVPAWRPAIIPVFPDDGNSVNRQLRACETKGLRDRATDGNSMIVRLFTCHVVRGELVDAE